MGYCINSVSMDFHPQPADETDDATKSQPVEEEVIACPATLGGCSSDGVCSLRSKQNVESRLKELKGGVKVNGISIGSVKETAL